MSVYSLMRKLRALLSSGRGGSLLVKSPVPSVADSGVESSHSAIGRNIYFNKIYVLTFFDIKFLSLSSDFSK